MLDVKVEKHLPVDAGIGQIALPGGCIVLLLGQRKDLWQEPADPIPIVDVEFGKMVSKQKHACTSVRVFQYLSVQVFHSSVNVYALFGFESLAILLDKQDKSLKCSASPSINGARKQVHMGRLVEWRRIRVGEEIA